MNNLIQPTILKELCNSLIFHKNKEQLNMILEPLQAIIQISLLSVSPIGTKLTIDQNILHLQVPSLLQPISRWYNSDKKDDIYFIYQVIKRFIKWYKNSKIDDKLFNLIIKMSIKGLDNLIKTYSNTNYTIIQVIYMYKDMLINNDKIDDMKISDDKVKIDEVFENIVNIYDENIINLIYNSLLIIDEEKDETNILHFINGLNYMSYKTDKLIQIWIKENLLTL
jgi:hypothetical protein